MRINPAAAVKEEAAPEATKEVSLDEKQIKQAQLEMVTVRNQSLPETITSNGRITVNENRSWHVGAITEGKNIEFRAEALNLSNHPLFPNPNMTVTAAQSASSGGFGQISASTVINYARRLQLTVRFVF